jgi:hypothetical protein
MTVSEDNLGRLLLPQLLDSLVIHSLSPSEASLTLRDFRAIVLLQDPLNPCQSTLLRLIPKARCTSRGEIDDKKRETRHQVRVLAQVSLFRQNRCHTPNGPFDDFRPFPIPENRILSLRSQFFRANWVFTEMLLTQAFQTIWPISVRTLVNPQIRPLGKEADIRTNSRSMYLSTSFVSVRDYPDSPEVLLSA